MKKLEIVIRPEKLPMLKMIFNNYDVGGAMFLKVSGYGKQKGIEYEYRGVRCFDSMISKTKAEVIVSDEIAEKLIDEILKVIPTGAAGDGKIFVSDISEVIRIRTGERNESAL